MLAFFKKNNVEVENLGGLARGIKFGDLLIERRVYNHNSTAYYANNDYVIRQWKSTNDLSSYHPTGTNYVAKSLSELLARLQKIIDNQRSNLK